MIAPAATPRGIPIIKPNPTMKAGAIARSGLFARVKRIIIKSSPEKSRGLIRNPVISAGRGKTKFPAAGLIVIKFIASKTTVFEIVEMIKPGRKIARLLPIHISPGESGVASKEVILPLTFSLIIGRLANAHINVIRIDSGKKKAIRLIIISRMGLAAVSIIQVCLFNKILAIKTAAIVAIEKAMTIIRNALVRRSSLKSL